MNYLSIDLSSKYLKCVLSSVSQDKEITILKVVATNVEDTNTNILTRRLRRIISKIETEYKIDMVLFIPFKDENSIMYNLNRNIEYLDDKKEMKNKIQTVLKEKEALLNTSKMPVLTDWSVQIDNPEEDYQCILGEYVSEKLMFTIVDMANKLNLKNYAILSPIEGLSYIPPKDNKVYLVIDYGHSSITYAFIRNGEFLHIDRINEGSSKTTDELTHYFQKGNTKLAYSSIDSEKHNSKYGKLKDIGSTEFIDSFTSITQTKIADFTRSHKLIVDNYIIVGGGGNLDIETVFADKKISQNKSLINEINTGFSRLNPKLNVTNQNSIPDEIKNYIQPSIAALQNYLFSDDIINYVESKSGGLLVRLKKISEILDKLKYPLIAILAIYIGLMSSIFWRSYVLTKTQTERTTQYASLSKEVTTSDENLTKLKDDLNKVIEGASDKINTNSWGTLFSSIASNTPKGLYVDIINTEDAKTFTIEGYCDARFKATDFTILLRNNIFKDAKLTDITTEKSLDGYPIYKYKINCTERR